MSKSRRFWCFLTRNHQTIFITFSYSHKIFCHNVIKWSSTQWWTNFGMKVKCILWDKDFASLHTKQTSICQQVARFWCLDHEWSNHFHHFLTFSLKYFYNVIKWSSTHVLINFGLKVKCIFWDNGIFASLHSQHRPICRKIARF